MFANENLGTLLIPDISGFTEFVSGVELSHSRHIIAELLEIIIDANHLGFEISEIEGDAVLFYHLGPPPSLQTLKEQAETFFLRFHQYLRQIKRDTLCTCGACQNVGKLTLKIIAHHGEMSLIKIKDRVKLIGKAVIVAHRLMKNHVPSTEYLLVSQAMLKASDENFPAPMQEYREKYGLLGELIIMCTACRICARTSRRRSRITAYNFPIPSSSQSKFKLRWRAFMPCSSILKK